MTSDKTPDNATGDSVTNAELITRVHAFMAALLTFLGFNVLPTETVFDMLDALTQWLADAKKIRRDPQGATARIWWDAFKLAREFDPVTSRVAHAADEYTAEFGKRFLPVAEEDRDTLNTADFDAMRTELDQADRYRGEICDALDGIAGERMFVHPKIIDELRAERDTLLKTNAHHASELAFVRQTKDGFIERVEKALGVDNGADIIETIESMRKQNESLARTIVEFTSIITSTCATIGCADASLLTSNAALLVSERDELKRQLANAIVSLPKPERVEAGQLWSMLLLCDWPHADGKGGTFFKPNGERIELWPRDIQDSALQFTGTR